MRFGRRGGSFRRSRGRGRGRRRGGRGGRRRGGPMRIGFRM